MRSREIMESRAARAWTTGRFGVEESTPMYIEDAAVVAAEKIIKEGVVEQVQEAGDKWKFTFAKPAAREQIAKADGTSINEVRNA